MEGEKIMIQRSVSFAGEPYRPQPPVDPNTPHTVVDHIKEETHEFNNLADAIAFSKMLDNAGGEVSWSLRKTTRRKRW